MTRTHENSLRTYLLTRIALAVPTVLILLTMVFLLMRVAPGNPIQAALGGHVPQAQIQAREHRAGYDRPILTQYVEYLKDAFTLNLGDSLTDHTPVTTIITDNGAATLELTIAAFFVAVVVGVSIGLVAGRWRDTPWDVGGRMFGIVIYAAPVFFLGFLAQLVFADLLGWLPVSGRASPEVTATLSQHTHLFLIDTLIDGDLNAFWDCFLHLILPAVTLGLVIERRADPPRAREPDADHEGRLRGGRPRTGRGRAARRDPPRLPQRPRAGDHRRRAPARAAAGRSDPDRGDVQLARASASSSCAT